MEDKKYRFTFAAYTETNTCNFVVVEKTFEQARKTAKEKTGIEFVSFHLIEMRELSTTEE
jgi:hypothetical protein